MILQYVSRHLEPCHIYLLSIESIPIISSYFYLIFKLFWGAEHDPRSPWWRRVDMWASQMVTLALSRWSPCRRGMDFFRSNPMGWRLAQVVHHVLILYTHMGSQKHRLEGNVDNIPLCVLTTQRPVQFYTILYTCFDHLKSQVTSPRKQSNMISVDLW